VRRIYGYPGDGINGIMGAFGRAEGELQFVQARHEELAAFMACAHAKFTGEVGVCLATSGPGAIHLLNGLYDAKLDHQPVLAIVGQQKRAAMGGDYQQEVDLLTLFKDVAHEYVHTAMNPAQVRHLVDRAMRIAMDRRTVTCLIFPNDVQELEEAASRRRHHGGLRFRAAPALCGRRAHDPRRAIGGRGGRPLRRRHARARGPGGGARFRGRPRRRPGAPPGRALRGGAPRQGLRRPGKAVESAGAVPLRAERPALRRAHLAALVRAVQCRRRARNTILQTPFNQNGHYIFRHEGARYWVPAVERFLRKYAVPFGEVMPRTEA
jgi:hypothetical protein